MTDPTPDRPLLRIVRGDPSSEELAALVAVLAARSEVVPAPGRSTTSGWRGRPTRGPGAWRLSGLTLREGTLAGW